LRHPRLSRAEQLAFTALLEVRHRQLETVAARDDRAQAFGDESDGRIFLRCGEVHVGRKHAIRVVRATADATAQLMELRETEAFRALDQHHGCVRDVDAHLHDGRRDQHLSLAVAESRHRLFLLQGLHVAVDEANGEVWEDVLRETLGFRLRTAQFDLVGLVPQRVDDECLPSFGDLTPDQVVSLVPAGFPLGQHRLDRTSSFR
jgi:hypothetical protein